jgi:hypothetical protein
MVAIAGCAPLGVVRDTIVDDSPAQIRKAQKIVVSSGSWSAVSRTRDSIKWEFRAKGECFCESTNYREMAFDNDRNKTERKVVSPESFAEVQRLLIESKIWTVTERSGARFESGYWTTIEWDGVQHRFDCVDPKELERLNEYLGELWTSATASDQSKSPPPFPR